MCKPISTKTCAVGAIFDVLFTRYTFLMRIACLLPLPYFLQSNPFFPTEAVCRMHPNVFQHRLHTDQQCKYGQQLSRSLIHFFGQLPMVCVASQSVGHFHLLDSDSLLICWMRDCWDSSVPLKMRRLLNGTEKCWCWGQSSAWPFVGRGMHDRCYDWLLMRAKRFMDWGSCDSKIQSYFWSDPWQKDLSSYLEGVPCKCPQGMAMGQ